MNKKLLLVACIMLTNVLIDARYRGHHGGYRRRRGGFGAGAATGLMVGVGTTAAISAANNNANQDPYAQVDKYEAKQELKELKAEARQKKLDRKEKEKEAKKAKKHKNYDSYEKDDSTQQIKDAQQKIQKLKDQLVSLRQSKSDDA